MIHVCIFSCLIVNLPSTNNIIGYTMENNQFKLTGLIAATFTPFDKDGKVNYSQIRPYAEHLIADGLDGVFVCGSTGESTSLTVEERKNVLAEWVKCIGGRIKVIAHVGGTCLGDCVDLASHAASLGVDAVGAIAPFYLKPSTVQDLINFYKPIAEAIGSIPLYCYHIPPLTGINIPMPAFLKAAEKEIPNFAGIKFTSSNFMEMMECINVCDGKFDILNGFDEMLLCALAMGCKGGVGSTYNYTAKTYRNILDTFFAGDIAGAQKHQMESIDIVNVIIKHGGGIRGGKAIMKVMGIDLGDCRVPLAPYTEEELETLRGELKAIGFDRVK